MPVAADGDQSSLYHRFVAAGAQRSALDGVRIPALSLGGHGCTFQALPAVVVMLFGAKDNQRLAVADPDIYALDAYFRRGRLTL